ncbi:hypothetical protein RHSIM_Rhsim11G0100400 [Rhododendron simsii]|uniref:Uncharacterized protein n=1 Tax=Rhododendron simsii TaxID=118357 RepID=A0A834G6Y9_RHOSS|nr:hypothetical protein RHSIM_Rhsim11G0100400 [Rhododendron simsii]
MLTNIRPDATNLETEYQYMILTKEKKSSASAIVILCKVENTETPRLATNGRLKEWDMGVASSFPFFLFFFWQGFVGAKFVRRRRLVLVGLPDDLVGGGGLGAGWSCCCWAFLIVVIS